MTNIIHSHEDRSKEIEKLEREVRRWRALALRAFWAGAVLGAIGSFWIIAFEKKGLADVGQYLSGTTATAWALAGVILIYVAFLGQRVQILLQQQELEDNRAELRETREEIRLQRKEAEEQGRILAQQRFETTFFQMLRTYAEIAGNLEVQTQFGAYRGRQVFRILKDEFSGKYNGRNDGRGGAGEIEVVQRAWEDFSRERHWAVDHCFRTLYHLFAFIHDQAPEEAREYVKIARAQLSSDELFLLFYVGLRRHGPPHFKQLIEDYSLLEPLPLETLLAPNHRSLYRWSAFSDGGSEGSNSAGHLS
jgi:hypothetical protein